MNSSAVSKEVIPPIRTPIESTDKLSTTEKYLIREIAELMALTGLEKNASDARVAEVRDIILPDTKALYMEGRDYFKSIYRHEKKCGNPNNVIAIKIFKSLTEK